MYTCLHAYMYVCICVYAYICTCAYVSMCMYMYVYVYVYVTCMCLCMCTCIYVYMYICMNVVKYIICAYVYMHICMYVYKYILVSAHSYYLQACTQGATLFFPFTGPSRVTCSAGYALGSCARSTSHASGPSWKVGPALLVTTRVISRCHKVWTNSLHTVAD